MGFNTPMIIDIFIIVVSILIADVIRYYIVRELFWNKVKKSFLDIIKRKKDEPS